MLTDEKVHFNLDNYGDFLSPITGDMLWHQENVTNKIGDAIEFNTTNFNNNIQLKKNIFISKTEIQKIKNPIKRTKSLPELTLEEIHEKKKSRFPF